MVAFKFPMSEGQYIGDSSRDKIYELSKDYCCLFRISGDYIISKNWNEHPLSSSKCRNLEQPIRDNGRLVSARHFETTCTEQDFFTYEYFYSWENLKIYDLYIYEKAYLPTAFVKAVLKLYCDKTTLKGVEGSELLYLLAKEMLNSTYGMTVTDIVREILEYDGEDYHSNYDGMTKEEYANFIKEQIARYNSNPYRFLFYPWGVWVTAYSRANLFSGIRACGNDYIYSDTDSIKILNPDSHMNYIKAYNADITQKIEEACRFHCIPEDEIIKLTRPQSIDGVEHPLGVWDFEGIYDEFMTLGAKRYMWRKGDKWNLTVAGVNKHSAMEYLREEAERQRVSPFDLFNENLVIPPSHSGRITLTYLDGDDVPIEGDVTDYLGNTYHYREESAIHMEPSDYHFNSLDSFLKFLFTIREEQW